MGININSKILLSVASIAAAAALIVGATIAFFSDTETSTGNTFVAGELDLKIDAEAHYAGMICLDTDINPEVTNLGWSEDGNPNNNTRPELLTTPCAGTWSLKDLEQSDTFFALNDIKPGDTGENTISIHVFDNDAWGWFGVDEVSDLDVDCTEPETESTDPDCNQATPVPGDGELQEALQFNVWLDYGNIPGFQCPDDAAPCVGDSDEGDNELDEGEPQLATPGPIDNGGESYELGPILVAVRADLGTECDGTNDDPDGDGVTTGGTGACQGLPDDGHLVGSTTYYFGVGWELPAATGNEVQSDSFVADMEFQVEQYRNNTSPGPFPL